MPLLLALKSACEAANLEFETAARLRDEIKRLEALQLGIEPPPQPTSTAGKKPAGRHKKQDQVPRPLGPGGEGTTLNPKKAAPEAGVSRKGRVFKKWKCARQQGR